MSQKIDVCGLSCPQPMMLTAKAINAGDFPIEVFTDNVTSRENVRRLAEKWGCQVTVENLEDGFKLLIEK